MTHANRINADQTPRWLAVLERRGYTFVSLDQALSDPAYATRDTHPFREGVSWFTRWAASLGRPLPENPQARIPQEILDRYREIAAASPEINE